MIPSVNRDNDNQTVPYWLYRSLMDSKDHLIEENQALRDKLGTNPVSENDHKAKTVRLSPLNGFKRHIARANHIVFKEVITNIQNNSNNEQR